MLVGRAYEQRFLWTGPEEFRRVLTSSMTMLASVGTVSWAFKLELARGFVVIALPLAAFLTLGARYALRSRVHAQRARGKAGADIEFDAGIVRQQRTGRA